ncbi:hypothetical protein [Cellulomonas fimi]|uniref:Uncharacterized protein n=1 Tax=Cellulomonas fimi TaxID=1708 RepID=A0A7Y0LWU5_CELFI|nr:hypothetical protein [Cellulomonas fimi]NMR19692.1 hypothetical protein [Cellulomonas fimi]
MAARGVDPRFARSVALWMRAYPRRWRTARGAELVEVLVDLAPRDATRLARREVLGLVRGGWATRWREHPPVGPWVLYRFFDRRLPQPYRPWAYDDIQGAVYPVRQYLTTQWWMVPFFTVVNGWPPPRWFLAFFVALLLGSLVIGSGYRRGQALLKHAQLRHGEPLVPGALVQVYAPRQRVDARTGLPGAVGLLLALGLLTFTAVAAAPKIILLVWEPVPSPAPPGYVGGIQSLVGPVGDDRVVWLTVLAVALAVGMVGAVVGHRRLRRLLPLGVDQVHRELRPLGVRGVLRLAYWVAVGATVAWLEISGRLVLWLSVPIGVGVAVLLPTFLLATAVVRGLPDGGTSIALADVWWIASRGRTPEPDRPAVELCPYPGFVPNPLPNLSEPPLIGL